MKRKALFVALLAFAVLSEAWALDIPIPGKYDSRVRFVDYNPQDVVKINAHFGYQVEITLSEGEYVVPKGVYMGDSEAWQFGTLANHIFIKPKAENGQTNLSVITNKRVYAFELTSHWSKKMKPHPSDMFFKVSFNYPQDEADRAALAAAQRKIDSTLIVAKADLEKRMSAKPEPKNYNYSVQGSEALAPDEAWDDGRFTHFRFKGSRDIPAIFIENEDGSESLINRHIEGGDVVVVQTLAKKFVLRKGNSVSCVFNDSYDPIGLDTKTGSTIPGVERVIKGEQQ